MAGLSRAQLIDLVESVKYTHTGRKILCHLTVAGTEIEGSSFCSTKDAYVDHVGEKVAYENALSNLRKYEIYAEKRNAYHSTKETNA